MRGRHGQNRARSSDHAKTYQTRIGYIREARSRHALTYSPKDSIMTTSCGSSCRPRTGILLIVRWSYQIKRSLTQVRCNYFRQPTLQRPPENQPLVRPVFRLGMGEDRPDLTTYGGGSASRHHDLFRLQLWTLWNATSSSNMLMKTLIQKFVLSW